MKIIIFAFLLVILACGEGKVNGEYYDEDVLQTDEIDREEEENKNEDNDIIINNDNSETIEQDEELDEDDTITDYDIVDIDNNINDEDEQEALPDDDITDEEITIDEDIQEEDDEDIIIEPGCGNGILDDGEFCEKGKIKATCVEVAPNLFKSGNVLCNNKCIGYTYKGCELKDKEKVLRLSFPEDTKSPYDQIFYEAVKVSDYTKQITDIGLNNKDALMCKKLGTPGLVFGGALRMNVLRNSFFVDDPKIGKNTDCRIGTKLEQGFVMVDMAYQNNTISDFIGDCTYRKEENVNEIDLFKDFPDHFKNKSYFIPGYLGNVNHYSGGYMLTNKGLDHSGSISDEYILCTLKVDY